MSNITEIFSSIQGEGIYIGKRQIFIRFAGCNINCNYCDTLTSKNPDQGTNYTVEELSEKIEELKTSDLHSIVFTGGEPLLSSEYIISFLKLNSNYKVMLETNGTLPKNMKDLLDYIDIVSLDIKLPEHFNKKSDWEKIFQNELDTLKLLIESKIEVYVKLVVLPETKISSLEEIMIIMKKQISFEDIEIIIQPVSPISKWNGQINNLFNYSECIGKYYSVSVIPQIHPFLNIL